MLGDTVGMAQGARGADGGGNPKKCRGDTGQGDTKFFEQDFWLYFPKTGLHEGQQDVTQAFQYAPPKHVRLHSQPTVGEVLCPRKHLGQQHLWSVQTFHLWETC